MPEGLKPRFNISLQVFRNTYFYGSQQCWHRIAKEESPLLCWIIQALATTSFVVVDLVRSSYRYRGVAVPAAETHDENLALGSVDLD